MTANADMACLRIVLLAALAAAAVVAARIPAGDQKDKPPPIGDRPLGMKIHFSAIHYAEGKDRPKQLVVKGTLGGAGQLELNPNFITLDPEGRIQSTTLMGYTPIKVRIEPADTPDPDGKNRKVYAIVPDTRKLTRNYSLVLSPNEAGPHHVLIREGERVIGTYPLVDPDRREHLDMAPKLAKASAEEQRAIAELRKTLSYSFRFRLEAKDTVTSLYFPETGDISKLDPALQGLRNVLHLTFQGGRLGRDGLKSLQEMRALKALHFTNVQIDDAGLASLKGLTQLKHMSFFGSRGLSDEGVAHLRNLTELTLLDLRNESFTATEPRAPRITDAGLGHLAGLSKLEHLNLQGQHITDAGLKHLKGMPDLQTLALSFSGITDEGLKHLEGLQKLRDLYLYGTRVTPAGRAALKAKLPMLDR